MHTDPHTHQSYLRAFEHFLQTGEKESLSTYTEATRPAAFLSVYRNGFIRASIGALESNFPSVKKLWGEEYFAQVASAYVNAAPPANATLLGYGFTDTADGGNGETHLSFVDFLQQQASELIERYPYVPDVCRLDQAWLQVLNEASNEALTVDEVQHLVTQGQDLSELPMRLIDSAQIVQLEFDIFELWGRLRFGDLSEDQQVELQASKNTVIFWQRDLKVQAKPLSVTEAAFMQHIKQFSDFDAATQQALVSDETFDISTLFAELLSAHLLTVQ